jgi:PAS domain S-box-containing protein
MFALSETNLRKLFPFFFRLNSKLVILESGDVCEKIFGESNGKSIQELIAFQNFSLSIGNNLHQLSSSKDLKAQSVGLQSELEFKVEIITDKNTNEILVLLFPENESVLRLAKLGLTENDFLSDFAYSGFLKTQLFQSDFQDELKGIGDELVRQQEEIIRKNEVIDEFDKFQDQSPEPIFRLSKKFKLLYANQSAKKIVLSDPKIEEEVFEKFKEFAIESNGNSFELIIHNRSYEVTIVSLAEKDVLNIYFRDISASIVYRDQLYQTSTRLHTLIDTMNTGILSESADRKILLVNSMFCELFDMKGNPVDFEGQDCSQAASLFKHLFKDEEAFVAGIDVCIKNRKNIFGEILYLKDGRILERDFVPVFKDEQYNGHIWKYQDVTDIMLNKESLRIVEDKYSRIIENLNFGLVEVDLEENITKVYPAFCELTGYNEGELLGQNAVKVFSFPEDMKDSKELNKLRQTGVSNVYERKIRKKDGGIAHIIISGAPIYNDKNEVVGSMGIHVDITDRKQLEDDLISAKETALSSVKAKEMFLANMSHEIRTPLNVINGMTDLLGDSTLDEDQAQYLSAVKKSADNLLVLINDILDFSKIEAGQLELEENTFTIKELFEHLHLSFKELGNKKGVHLLCEVDAQISEFLKGDSNKLNQVLVNLVSNALKFTQDGSVFVQAKLLEQNEFTQKINFSVRDTGIGIDEKNQQLIFNTFSQEDATISRRYGGTGLGLSISKGIVEKMGGTIQLVSERNKGSEFSFSLEFKTVQEAEEKPETKVNTFQNLTEIKLLVVEDNELNRLLITSVLKKEQIDFKIAENGLEAIQFLVKESFDLILMDIQMPIMDGITATREIRTKLHMSIPIIALSANATIEDTKKYLESGMNDHVPKPFKKEELFSKIKMALGWKESTENSSMETEPKEIIPLYSLIELENISGGDESFIKSILVTFLESAPVQLSKLNSAIISSDFLTIRNVAHQMKPSIDLLHIEAAKPRIRNIEKEADQALPDRLRLETEFIEMKNALDLVMNQMRLY